MNKDRKVEKKEHKIDPCLIVDDIVEKLNLLDYSHKFCKDKNRRPISKTYFAIQEIEDEKHNKERQAYLIELSYWLLSLGFTDLYKKSKNRKELENSLRNPYSDVRFIHFKSMEDAVDSLIKDLGKFKVHLPENFDKDELI